VKAAKSAGIPVINIDRNADGAPGDTFIATDSVASARQVCDYILKQAGGKGEMLIVHGQKGTTPEVDRTKGCGEALAKYPDVKVVGELWSEQWHQDEGFKLTSDLLQAHPNVSIIFGQAVPSRSAQRRPSRWPISGARSGSPASTVTPPLSRR
jgi:ribose transport system substrate-binding protein